jgi:hypothetical protein
MCQDSESHIQKIWDYNSPPPKTQNSVLHSQTETRHIVLSTQTTGIGCFYIIIQISGMEAVLILSILLYGRR